MGEQSIEEAWDEFGFCPCRDARCEDDQKTARALALATLWALQATEGAGYSSGMGRFECDFEAIRARIEALGR